MDNLINSIVPLVLTAFIFLITGIAMGMLITSLRSSPEKNHSASHKNLKEIICFYRDKRNAHIVLEINGKFYNKVDDLSIKLQTSLVQLSDDLRIWLGGLDYSERLETISSSEEEIPVISPQKEPETVEGRETIKEKKSDEVDFQFHPEQTNIVKPVPVISFDSSPGKPVEESDTSKSIAAQIDEILQEKLAASSMKDHIITLLELPDKGLVVVVDNEQYESVEEVPDTAVKKLIKDCVAEWEKGTRTE